MFVPAVCVPVRLPARSKRPNRLEALRKQCFFFYCKGLPSPPLFWYTELQFLDSNKGGAI
nr:MAG TPA: 5'-3' exonuclease [Caudoviricetes sp.]